jgi:hypothetical protein
LLRVCLAFFLVLCGAGFASLYSFRSRALPPQSEDQPNRAALQSSHAGGATANDGRPVR